MDFWQLDDIFEPPGQNELIIWKTDSRFVFSLASPALRIRACEAHGLALTLLLPYSNPILGKKIRLFCSLKHCSQKFTDHLNAIWYRYKLQPHSQGSLLRKAGRREPWERGCTSYGSDKRVLYSNNQFMNGILTWFDSNSSFRNLRIILSDLRFHNTFQFVKYGASA